MVLQWPADGAEASQFVELKATVPYQFTLVAGKSLWSPSQLDRSDVMSNNLTTRARNRWLILAAVVAVVVVIAVVAMYGGGGGSGGGGGGY